MKHSTEKPTPAEQARLDALHAMPCIACQMEYKWDCQMGRPGVSQPSKTEVHHIVDKGYRKHSGGHVATLPLCGWHHRAELLYPLTSSEMLFLHGPSLSDHKKKFVATYGSERELLEIVDRRLAESEAA